MPKGVVWRHEDVFYALGGGTDPVDQRRAITDPSAMVAKGANGGLVHLPVAPLMHGATQWCVMGQSFVGSKIVLMAKFDPHEVWRLVGDEKVNSVMITGDAMGKPLIESLDDAGDGPRPLVAAGRGVVGRALLRAGEGPVLRAPAQPRHHRRHRLLGGRQQRHDRRHRRQHRHEERPDRAPARRDGGVRREPRAGRAGVGRHRQDRPLRRHPARATTTTRRRRPRSSFRCGGTRYVMPGDYATVEADGSHHPARPGLDRHQLRRREDLPRGGRVGRALPPRRHGRHRVRRARRALGPDGGRHRPAAGRARGAVARVASRSTAASRSPATRCPAGSTSSTRSSARRRASPTTPGPPPS